MATEVHIITFDGDEKVTGELTGQGPKLTVGEWVVYPSAAQLREIVEAGIDVLSDLAHAAEAEVAA